jgi:Right handed beta helix region/Polysaccharide lyase
LGVVAVSALGQTPWRVTITGPNNGQVTVWDVSADSQTQAEDLSWQKLRAASTTSATSASGSSSCTKVASTTGSDSASGTEAAPFRTAEKLVSSLSSGQTGCLRAGTYSTDNQVKVSKAGITLASYPGERARLKTRLWIAEGANGVTVQDLVLDGVNADDLPSPTVNANDAVFRNNEVTNEHTAICFDLGSRTYGRANRTLIEDNRIHDCGSLPATNHDHGIYVARADYTVIRDNLIYRNADRGIQLYPDAQHSTITGNVIDGNGQGILFAGDFGEASSNNLVENNLITNAQLRYNVESWYPDGNPIGTGNIVRNNCIWGGERGNIDGPGFSATGNLIANPLYLDRASGNFALQGGSPCAGILRRVGVSLEAANTWHVTLTGPGNGQVTVWDVSADSQTQARNLAWQKLRAASTTSAVATTPSTCDVTAGNDPFAASVPSCAVVAQDTAQDSDPLPFWGSIQCESSSRYEYPTSGGDPHPAAGGASQGNDAYRRLTVLDGDDYYGERCELGENDLRTGPTAFYREGQHRLTYISFRLGESFPLANPGWQTVMRMKQTQPSANGGGAPVISLEAQNGRWNLTQSDSAGDSSDAHVLWSTPAQTGLWTRFAFDVVYSQDPAIGSIKVSVDLNGDGDSLDPDEQSPTFQTYTLKYETTNSDYLDAGDSIPSHLRAGVYHDSAIDCPSTGTCSDGVDNVQVVRAR